MASLQCSHQMRAAHLVLILYCCAFLAGSTTGYGVASLPPKMKPEHFTYVPGSDGYTCSLQCQAAAKRDCGDGCKVVGSAMRLLPAPSASARVPGTAAARFMREKPVRLWDAATGAAASFRTVFVIRMSPDPGTCMADGMAFLLAPGRAVPKQSWGRALGVAENGDPKHLKGLVRDGQIVLRFVTHGAKSPYVALSSWGSHGNAAQSNRMYPLADAGSAMAVWLEYDAENRSVEVKMAVWKSADEFSEETISALERDAKSLFTAPLDLTESAESSSYLGFSAATGACTEINELFFWEFQQFKLDVDAKEMPKAPSPAPGPSPVSESGGDRHPVEAPFAADAPTPGPATSSVSAPPSDSAAALEPAPVPAPAPAPSVADVVPAPSPAYAAEEPAPAPAPFLAGVAPAPGSSYAVEEPAQAPSVGGVVPAPIPAYAAEEPAPAPAPGPSVAHIVRAPSPKAYAEKQAPPPFARAFSPVPSPAEVPSLAPSSGHRNERHQLCDRQICKLLMPLCQMAGHVAPTPAW